MYFKLAWRNLWRNKRRTLITTASVFMAVILAVLMRSMQLGSYQRMIDNVVSFYTGHIQIHQQGYFEEQTIDNSFEQNDTLTQILQHDKHVSNWVPRLESFALASTKDQTKGTIVVGTDPDAEDRLTHLRGKLVQGEYLKPGDTAVLISEGLAEYLNLKVNDTIVLLGQGFHGVNAAAQYKIKGVVKFPTPELNEGIVYMPLPEAQKFYGSGNRLTTLAISIGTGGNAISIASHLRKQLKGMPYEVKDWKQMLPEMVQLIEADNSGGIIVIAILYMVIAFGIFGTILMMLAEREREFGILVAIGMKKPKLGAVVVLETVLIGALGVVAGVLGAIPVITYFHLHPIHVSGELAASYQRFGLEPVFPFSTDPSIFITQAAIVLGVSVLLAMYPWFRLMRLQVIDAIKS